MSLYKDIRKNLDEKDPEDYDYSTTRLKRFLDTFREMQKIDVPKMEQAYDNENYDVAVKIAIDILEECYRYERKSKGSSADRLINYLSSDVTTVVVREKSDNMLSMVTWKLCSKLKRTAKGMIKQCNKYLHSVDLRSYYAMDESADEMEKPENGVSYRGYLESMITESGLEESDQLMDWLCTAESVEEFDAIEEYLTEGRISDKIGNTAARRAEKEERTKWVKADMDTDRWIRRDKHVEWRYATEDEMKEYTRNVGSKAYKNATDAYKAGKLVVGASIASLATIKIINKMKIIARKRKLSLKYVKEMEDLLQDMKEIKDRCSNGEITAKEAEDQTEVIKMRIIRLSNDIDELNKDPEIREKTRRIRNSVSESVEKSDDGDYLVEESFDDDNENSNTDKKRKSLNLDSETVINAAWKGVRIVALVTAIVKTSRVLKTITKSHYVKKVEDLEKQADAINRRYKGGYISKEEAVRKLLVVNKKMKIVLMSLANSKDEREEVREKAAEYIEKLDKELDKVKEYQS